MENEMVMRYMDIMEALFVLYCDGPVLRNGHKVYPKDRIAEQYPDIPEAELDELIKYLQSAEEYCETIGDNFADQYPAVPDAAAIQACVKECQKNYPWLDEETIINMLDNIYWMSNR